MPFSFGLPGMSKYDVLKMRRKFRDDLRGKGYFGYQYYGGFTIRERLFDKFYVHRGLSRTGNTVKYDGARASVVNVAQCILLIGVEYNMCSFIIINR